MAGTQATRAAGLPEALVELTASFSEAETIDELERRYLDRARAFVDTRAVGFYLLDPFTHGADRIAARGVSDYFLARYEEVGRRDDPVLERLLRDREAVHNGSLMTREEWRRLPVYGDVFRVHRMTTLLEAPVLLDGEAVGTLNFGDGDDKTIRPPDVATASLLGKVVGLAVASIRCHEELARERDQLLGALELCDDAVILTDLRAGTRRMNAAAREVLARCDPEEADELLDELMAAARPCRDGSYATRPVTLRDGCRVTARLRSVELERDAQLVVSLLDVHDDERLPRAVETLLTPRERDVVRNVVRGLRDAEIASRLFLSPYTVKEYLRNAYRKLGVGSRVELTRLVARAPERGDPLERGE